jgi:tetratricopeptide (TPR) repeat protein
VRFSRRVDKAVVIHGEVHGGIHLGDGGSARIVPRQLPRAVAGFINRDRERADLDREAARESVAGQCPVVVLKGTPGVGKTAMAVYWAHKRAEDFPDGQLYVNLRGHDNVPALPPSAALESLLRSLGFESAAIPVGEDERAALYRSVMFGTRRLLLLDNAESAHQIGPLFPTSHGCFVVVTTRNELRGIGALEGVRKVTLEVLASSEAVSLLEAVIGEGSRPGDDTELLARVATLCAGLPLALRLAGVQLAARPRVSLAEFIKELEARRLNVLGDASDPDPIRTVFDLSYERLSVDVARTFRLLGRYPGVNYTAESVGIAVGRTESETRLHLDTLVSAHLLRETDEGRFEMHDLLREYAADLSRSRDSDEMGKEVVTRLAAWYVTTMAVVSNAVGTDSLELPDPDGVPVTGSRVSFTKHGDARAWYEAERASLAETAIASCVAGRDDLGWTLAAWLLGIYEVTLEIDDWMATSKAGLDAARRLGDRFAEAVMLESLGKAYRATHQLDLAERYQRDSLTIRDEIGNVAGRIRSLNALGLVHRRAERLGEARRYFLQVRSLAVEAADRRFEAFAALNLGGLDLVEGLPDAALVELELARDLLRATGQHIYEVDANSDLALAYLDLNRPADAVNAAAEAVTIATTLHNRYFLATALTGQARVEDRAGNVAAALACFDEVIALHRQLRDLNREALVTFEAGDVYKKAGDLATAMNYYQRAAQLHSRVGDTGRADQASAKALSTGTAIAGGDRVARPDNTNGV